MTQQSLITFNIKIPEELRKEIKKLALKRNQTIQEMVTSYLQQMVKNNEKDSNN